VLTGKDVNASSKLGEESILTAMGFMSWIYSDPVCCKYAAKTAIIYSGNEYCVSHLHGRFASSGERLIHRNNI